MHKAISSVLIVSFVLLILVSSGCVIPKQTTEQTKNNLQTAISTLQANPRYKNNLSSTGIYYIRGINVSQTGIAEEWTIGATQGNSSFFFLYNGKTESIIDWPDVLNYDEIRIGQFIYPEKLFDSHPLLIKNLTNDGESNISEIE